MGWFFGRNSPGYRVLVSFLMALALGACVRREYLPTIVYFPDTKSVKRLNIKVGMEFSYEFQNHILPRMPFKGLPHVPTGVVSVAVFRHVFRAMFERAHDMSDGNLVVRGVPASKDYLDAVIVPEIVSISNTWREASRKLPIFTYRPGSSTPVPTRVLAEDRVEWVYRFTLHPSGNAKPVTWTISGKSETGGVTKGAVDPALVARDAGAKFIDTFRKQPGIRKWLRDVGAAS